MHAIVCEEKAYLNLVDDLNVWVHHIMLPITTSRLGFGEVDCGSIM